jgi:N-acetylglucosaminyl-diphospho-decaprenol L-rhamnosyltransferase
MSELTIVTVTYNSSAVIGTLLESLRAVDASVIVVDNGSSDTTIAIASAFPNVRVIKSGNIGYGCGANRGFTEAKTPYVLLVNPDVILSKEAVETMLAAASARPDIGILGAKMFKRLADGSKEYSELPAFAPDGLAYSKWIVGALMLIRADALKKLGAFDENIFLFYEETDLCKRFTDAGYKIAITQAEAEHAIGNSSAPSDKLLKIKAWHSAWSKAYYYRKHFSTFTYYKKAVSKILTALIRIGKSTIRGDRQGVTKNLYELRGTVSFLCGAGAFDGGVGRLT